MMKRFINQELMCGINSKIYYMIIIFLSSLFGLIIFLNYSAVTNTYKNFEKEVEIYQKNNLDIDKDLNGEYKVEKSTITNPILYFKETTSRYIYTASPQYIISQFLESSILFFPLVFGFFGLYIATYDTKYKTIKLKTVRMSRRAFGITKQLSISLSIFIVLVISLLIAFFAGLIVYNIMSNNIPLDDFNSKTVFANSSSMFIKFIFAYIIALIFAEIGYALGIIFKNPTVGLIVIVIYMYIVPNLGSFDIKNSIRYFARNIYDFYGMISVEAAINTSFIKAVATMVFVFVISVFANMIITTRRSSFDS